MGRYYCIIIIAAALAVCFHPGHAVSYGDRSGRGESTDIQQQPLHRVTSVRVHSSGPVVSKTSPNRTRSGTVVSERQRVEATGEAVQQTGGNSSQSNTMQLMSADQWHDRVRNKNARLFDIQRQIMFELQLKRRPNVTGTISPEHLEQIRQHLDSSSHSGVQSGDKDEEDDDVTTRRFFALRPTCPVVDGVRQDWFAGGHEFRLYFHIDPPDDDRSRKTKVTSAVLRLSRVPRESPEKATNQAEKKKNRRPADSQRRVTSGRVERGTEKNKRVNEKTEDGRQTSRRRATTNKQQHADKLTLAIYQYTQPVVPQLTESKHMVKNTTFRDGRYGYLNLNIKSLVRQWYRNPGNNFGLELSLADESGNRIDPRSVFAGFNCSHPISDGQPALISMSIPRDETEDLKPPSRSASFLGGLFSPNLDIATVQVPRKVGKMRRGGEGEVRRRVIVHRREILGQPAEGLRRRVPRDTSGEEQMSECRLRKEFVRFSEIGLSELIVKPSGFVFGTCEGMCNRCVNDADKTTSEYPRQHNKTVTECCQPNTRDDLDVILKDGYHVTLGKLLVRDCACFVDSS